MNSQLKNILIGIVIGGIAVAGGYAFFSSEKNSNSNQTTPKPYIRTDNPTQTRSFLDSGEKDKDCGDFSTQREAQSFFEANGGPSNDPHGLDRDGDGRACQSLP